MGGLLGNSHRHPILTTVLSIYLIFSWITGIGKKKLKPFFVGVTNTEPQPFIKATMTTYQIPAALHTAIASITKQTMDASATALAEKYGFDPAEAQRFLESLPVPEQTESKKTKGKGKGKAKQTVVDSGSAEASDGVKPKVKRAQTGYLLFASEMRPNVKEEMTASLEEGAKVMPQAVIKALATRWKALEPSEQEEYKQRAKTPPVSSDGE